MFNQSRLDASMQRTREQGGEENEQEGVRVLRKAGLNERRAEIARENSLALGAA